MSCGEKSYDTAKKNEWMKKLESVHIQRTDMNKLIMNYLVTEGFKEAAEKFQQESGINPSIDLNTMDDRIKIRDAVQNGRIDEAISLVNKLHPELLDIDRHLYFHLQQLQLIELIRAGKLAEALQFAQERLSEVGESDPSILRELERTLALLAFERPMESPFNDLLQQTHRQKFPSFPNKNWKEDVLKWCEIVGIENLSKRMRICSLHFKDEDFIHSKIASELNAAILKAEHVDHPEPKLFNLLRVTFWAQDELNKKKVKYPRMTDISTATIEPPK